MDIEMELILPKEPGAQPYLTIRIPMPWSRLLAWWGRIGGQVRANRFRVIGNVVDEGSKAA